MSDINFSDIFNATSIPSSSSWETVTTDTTAIAGRKYRGNKAVSQILFTLPSTSAVDSTLEFATNKSTGFKVAQQAGQYIVNEEGITSVGINSGISSSAAATSVGLICIEANLGWLVHKKLGTVSNYFDTADIDAVITAIEATGITLTTPQKTAITNRIVNAKLDGAWDKWYAYYGFVGGTAASHAINWKYPSSGLYNITWSGSLTHNSLGTKGAGGYGNTGFRSSTVSGLTTIGLSYYTTEARVDGGQIESFGSIGSNGLGIFDYQQYYSANLGDAAGTFAVRSGFTSGSTWEKNLYSANFVPNLFTFNIGGNAIEATTVAATTTVIPNANLWIFDENNNNAGGTGRSSTIRMGSYCINKGLTAAQETANYISELAFQTALGRN